MNRDAGSEDRAPANRPLRFRVDVQGIYVGRWFHRLLDRLKPTVYVDGRDLPDEPESPYRARLTLPLEQSTEGVEVRERDVVHGEVRVIYEVRCSCGKRWFNPQLDKVQFCPRCSRAVLIQLPD